MDTEVRKPVEGPTVIHQSAPIHLVEIITRKSDNAVIKHTVTGMTSSDLKKLNVRGIHGLNLYNLKKGAALKLELEDVFIDLQLQKNDAK